MLIKRKLNTRGVSPLIATILLVAVSLSLAGILYSWASQNAGNTVSSVTETQQQWTNCTAINLFIEEGCSYNDVNGISFILSDHSTVDIDENIEISVSSTTNVVEATTFAPNFKGGAMSVNRDVFSDPEAFDGLGSIQRVYVFVKGCPDRKATTMSCD